MRDGAGREEKAITVTPTKRWGGVFFQQVVNSVAPPSFTILIKLISPHAVMRSGRTKPPWNHENCAPGPPEAVTTLPSPRCHVWSPTAAGKEEMEKRGRR